MTTRAQLEPLLPHCTVTSTAEGEAAVRIYSFGLACPEQYRVVGSGVLFRVESERLAEPVYVRVSGDTTAQILGVELDGRTAARVRVSAKRTYRALGKAERIARLHRACKGAC